MDTHFTGVPSSSPLLTITRYDCTQASSYRGHHRRREVSDRTHALLRLRQRATVACRPRPHPRGVGQTSAEGKHVGLDSGLEERDLERVLLDAAGLTDELVEPRLGDDAVALLVDVDSV